MSSRRPFGTLDRKRSEVVSQSAFAFLFSELIQYSQTRVNTADELIAKLEDAGYSLGHRTLELACWRDRSSKREIRMRGILQFITQTLWKTLFGVTADNLQRSVDSEDEYMIIEKEPLVNAFISNAPVNCAAFVAGILRGVLEASCFPAQVTAHENEEGATVYLIKFDPEVLQREKRQT